MVEFAVPDFDYADYSNRQLAAVPLAVLGVALLVILGWYAATGTPVQLGMEFTGGTEVQFTTGQSLTAVEQAFSGVDVEAVRPGVSGNVYFVEAQAGDVGAIEAVVDEMGYENARYESVPPTIGAAAQGQALVGLGLAFIGMSALVFLLFRTFVPSVAVIVSAFSDMVIPIAVMNLLGIKFSFGTVAGLLMLIGYSVDSDILLNNHVLRRRGGFYESAFRAMRTGVTMTLTSISAMVVMTVVATFLEIPLLPQIGLILVVGLVADLMNTYMLNMSLLRWYKYEGVNA